MGFALSLPRACPGLNDPLLFFFIGFTTFALLVTARALVVLELQAATRARAGAAAGGRAVADDLGQVLGELVHLAALVQVVGLFVPGDLERALVPVGLG